jgi:hypothetical protein
MLTVAETRRPSPRPRPVEDSMSAIAIRRARSLSFAFALAGLAVPSSMLVACAADTATAGDEVVGEGSYAVDVKTAWGNRRVIARAVGADLVAGGDEIVGRLETDGAGRHVLAATLNGQRWPVSGGFIQIPYEIDTSVDANVRARITAAMALWTGRVNVQFTTPHSGPNYIAFSQSSTLGGVGGSKVGMVGGAQTIIIGANLTAVGIAHEIGHSMGLWHEQQRNDRSYFVQVAPEVVSNPGDYEIQPAGTATDVGIYNFQSLMEYASDSFGSWDWQGNFRLPLRRTDGTFVNGGANVSNGDAFAINEMYFGDSNGYLGDVVLSVSTGARFGWDGRPVPGGEGFAPARKVNGYFGLTGEVKLVGDFDANGISDMVAFQHGVNGANGAYVLTSDGGGMRGYAAAWHTYMCAGGQTCLVGDVDGDHRDDAVAISPGASVWVATSNGSSFGTAYAAGSGCGATDACFLADVSGDGRADLVKVTSAGALFVGRSTYKSSAGNYSFATFVSAGTLKTATGSATGVANGTVRFADLDGDGKKDIVYFAQGSSSYTNQVLTAQAYESAGTTAFATATVAQSSFCWSGETCDVGDFTGDGKVDVITFIPTQNKVYVAHGAPTTPYTFVINTNTNLSGSEMPATGFPQSGESFVVGDFTGDGKTDIAKFHNSQTTSYGIWQ